MSRQPALIRELKHRAARIRWMSLKSTAQAGSGHPTSCNSAADLLAALFFHVMRYDPQNPGSSANDRLVLSKGHAAPALYAAWCEAGYLTEEQVYTLRQMNSPIEGHPMPYLPFVDVATGSLGQGLSVGLGIALHQAKVMKNDARTFVLLGDGEMAEGSVWEAFALAAHLKMDNLMAIVDVNRLGQSRETMHGHDLRAYARKVEAFGWEALTCNGHDFEDILTAFQRALKVKGKPACILAKTIKGYGVSAIADLDNWHGKPLKPGPELDKALEEVAADLMKTPPKPSIPKPSATQAPPLASERPASFPPPPYAPDAKVATRQAVGDALLALGGADSRIWVIDGDTQNSTYSQKFADRYPDRFVECFIAEQNMAGIAAGLAARGLIPFGVTFGAFLARAFDQIRMSALSGLPVKFLGTHAGISIGEDGPSQMALEDLAFFRTLPNGAVLYPSDAVSAYGTILALARHNGPGYVRLSRPATPILYPVGEQFPLGEIKIIHAGKAPKLTVISAGVIIHEVLRALKDHPNAHQVQVIDLYCLKPFPTAQVAEAVGATGGRVVVFEEHAPAGGIGEAVATALAGKIREWTHVAVDRVPRSGPPEALLASFGLSASTIRERLTQLLA
ncbi:MAG: Transketolase [Candidatus Ozemobacter sibiricus]|jgi:transketolase|uniref:Transketolase n=1 Tax=Candidatus Ozemobacter sibiricus TaxID=2268124 RepID=A0A367ZWQ8_9BACT|nr:MAG: Transketolase [Candidatus Ozemobacter sibiricus]